MIPAQSIRGFPFVALLAAVVSPLAAAEDAAKPAERPLRIIVFGAHPDDAEYKAGGTAAKWAKLGHAVKLVSVTNGDIGHWRAAGEELARRRAAEVTAAAEVLGVTSEVLGIHDGELMPTLENRRLVTRLIREWKADVVICHRPWDYHPDHRYVGILVQDAAFMVTVPFFCPEVPALKKNPVFMHSSDMFQKPIAFQPDVAVAVDDVFETKLEAVHRLTSQAYEGGAIGDAEQMAAVPAEADVAGRKAWLRERWMRRQAAEADRFRDLLVRLYGEEQGRRVRYAEAFEVCEYGHRPTPEELRRLFPFFEEVR
ncbi:MAG: PIG-L family deacetylase [Planctomycetia bacterium]|nr:PIG-L family deacetylase [Planctomycetia bacterium]